MSELPNFDAMRGAAKEALRRYCADTFGTSPYSAIGDCEISIGKVCQIVIEAALSVQQSAGSDRRWWPVPDNLWHYSAQFRDVKTGACIQARRMKHAPNLIEDERAGQYKDGDWFVDTASAAPFVLSHEEFCDRYVLIFPPPVHHRHE